MKLKPWALTVMAIFLPLMLFFVGWAIAPNIPSREIIGFIGISVCLLVSLISGIAGIDKTGEQKK